MASSSKEKISTSVHTFYGNRSRPSYPPRLNDILSRLEDYDDAYGEGTSHDIYIQPPDNSNTAITDEDSGEEDAGGNINNLPGSMLRVPIANIPSSDEEEEEIRPKRIHPLRAQVLQYSSSDEEAPIRPTKKRALPVQRERRWKKRDLNPSFDGWQGNDAMMEELKKKKLNPIELFELFFDNYLVKLMVEETNRYAFQHNINLGVSEDEIKCVLGVLLLSGYVQVPRRRMYWEQASDTHSELISGAIRRDRFETIFTNLHFTDNNNLNTADKYVKLRPLIDKLNSSYLLYAPTEEYYSFDESMCEYFGKHGCKQCLRGKPIRFGFKIWCGTTTLGYVVWFQPYQGKGDVSEDKSASLGLGGDLVVKFAKILHNRKPLNYHLCFDNFFTSIKLVSALTDLGIKGTGTVRDNRTEKCPLIKPTELKKKSRGQYDYRVDELSEIVVCRWNDNNVVTLCSNAAGVYPTNLARRYSAEMKKHIQVEQPHMIKVYNEHMGGVDRMDQNINKYRVAIRGKKWYSSLVTYLIDQAINNAWQLHKICDLDCPLDLLAFRRRVATFYLKRYGTPPCQGQRGRPSQKPTEIRYDRYNHMVIPQDKQTRCAHCHQKTTTRCEKCDKGLHVKCFKAYHTQ